MFTSIFFLLLAVFLISMGPEIPGAILFHDPIIAFVSAIGVFFVGDLFIALFARFFPGKKELKLTIVNLFLLILIGVYYFVFAAYRASGYFHTELFSAFICLGFFISGLWIFHAFNRRFISFKSGWQEVRLLIPICLPYFILSPIFEFINSGSFSSATILILTILTLASLLILMPKVTAWLWGGKPIDNPELMDRLNALCKKAHFRHAGITTWPAMAGAYTAAILGISPRYRYILFTNKVLDDFPPEEIEAILAHEIGHSTHKHLIFYPFIFFGLAPFLSLISIYLIDPILDSSGLEPYYVSSELVRLLTAFGLFFVYALILWAYFRGVFGFYSRMFERQADLNVFNLKLPPENMIKALDHLAIATGNTHHNPSWHHDSIQNRINFLEAAIANPQLITKHHRKVFFYRILYLFLFVLAIFWLYMIGGL